MRIKCDVESEGCWMLKFNCLSWIVFDNVLVCLLLSFSVWGVRLVGVFVI